MKSALKESKTFNVWSIALRFLAIAFWFAVMVFAVYGGLFIHAFVGFASLAVLTYLMIKQAEARLNYLKKKRIRQLSNYHVGENYMNVFDANRRNDL